jgi:hypothetical protein
MDREVVTAMRGGKMPSGANARESPVSHTPEMEP